MSEFGVGGLAIFVLHGPRQGRSNFRIPTLVREPHRDGASSAAAITSFIYGSQPSRWRGDAGRLPTSALAPFLISAADTATTAPIRSTPTGYEPKLGLAKKIKTH